MKVDLFDFDLPESAIATEPAEPRESGRLLHVGPEGSLTDHRVGDLPSLLKPGDLLVFNDTKVIPAQLEGRRERLEGRETFRASVGLTLHRRLGETRWLAFARGAKKIRPGDDLVFEHGDDELRAAVLSRREDGSLEIDFAVPTGGMVTALTRFGRMPLPPYITAKREVRPEDSDNYQTVFARHEGAVAAPTAGLHFTPGLIGLLESAGIGLAEVTLHVGAGTFLPVKVEDTDDHVMHVEWGELPAATAGKIAETRAHGGRIVAVGTTSLRILEASAHAVGEAQPWSGETDIFITPGYRFRAVDILMTNFHLPRSTLFMLVSAFSGFAEMKAAYQHATDAGYRFYSYGDTSLLSLKRETPDPS